jgi:tetratricopeptide (TPR) repeat protein
MSTTPQKPFAVIRSKRNRSANNTRAPLFSRGASPRAAIAIVTALVVIFVASTTRAASNEQVRKLNEAQKLYNKEQYQQAAGALQSLIKEDPSVAEAYRLLGHVHLAMDQTGKARQAFVDAIQRGRVTVAMLGRLIRLDRAAGRSHAAMAGLWLRSLLAPDAPAWQQLTMRMLMDQGWPRRAQALGRELIEKRPADVAVLQMLGNAYLKTDDYRAAIEPFITAYRLGSDEPRLAQTIAGAWQQLDRPREAVRWYDRAIAASQPSAERDEMVLRRAALLLNAEMTDRPTPALKRLAQRKEAAKAGQAALRFGQLASARGDANEALKYWQRAVDLGVEEPALLAALGEHYFNSQDDAQAIEMLRRRLDAADARPALHRMLITSLLRTGASDAASRRLQTYLARFGLDAQARELIGAWRRGATAR